MPHQRRLPNRRHRLTAAVLVMTMACTLAALVANPAHAQEAELLAAAPLAQAVEPATPGPGLAPDATVPAATPTGAATRVDWVAMVRELRQGARRLALAAWGRLHPTPAATLSDTEPTAAAQANQAAQTAVVALREADTAPRLGLEFRHAPEGLSALVQMSQVKLRLDDSSEVGLRVLGGVHLSLRSRF